MTKKPFIAGNWKMYKTINEAVRLAAGIKRELLDFSEAEIVLCPVYTSLFSVYEIIMETDIKLGAQDLFWEAEGAYTGEVSPVMLKDSGCEVVIIGHSERRKYFHETDVQVNKKIKTALSVGLIPIFCVGEILPEREEGKTLEVIRGQLLGGFKDLSSEDIDNTVIAYEPVWAIGTGKTATPQQAEEVHKFIRGWIEEKFSLEIARRLRIVYGGSVKPENIRELMKEDNIDGALVGGASLEVSSFVEIVKNSVV